MTVLSAVATVGCVPSTDDTQTKFISLPQRYGGYVENSFLINKLDSRRWNIFYGFEDNNSCGNSIKKNKLERTVTKSLRVWLSPLQELDDENITRKVNNIQLSFFKRDTESTDKIVREKAEHVIVFNNDEKENATITVVFYCKQGRAYVRVPYYSLRENITHSFINIHMFKKHDDEGAEHSMGEYSKSTLHHEMGHAFGLGDTYIERLEVDESGGYWRYNLSEGGSPETVGKQPLSVMSHPRIAALDDRGKFVLTTDDREGIKWLYRYYHGYAGGEYVVGLNDCPAGFLYESSTSGCAPENAILFELERGTAGTIKRLMAIIRAEDLLSSAIRGRSLPAVNNLFREMRDIYTPEQLREVITRGDDFGVTPLHEAAWQDYLHEGNFYEPFADAAMAEEIDKDIEDHFGVTPRTIIAWKQSPNNNFSYFVSKDILTDLRDAVREGDEPEAKKALQALRDMNVMRINAGYYYGGKSSLLMVAAWHGHAEVAALLLAQPDIAVNEKNIYGLTALMQAAVKGRAAVVALLLAHPDMAVDEKDAGGRTALMHATARGHTEVVTLLEDVLSRAR